MATIVVNYDPTYQPDPNAEKKIRTITAYKDRVYLDIDALTYKFMEAQKAPTPSQENAISSDVHEPLDTEILQFHVDHQDARLRKRFRYAFAEGEEVIEADNSETGEAAYIYNLQLPVHFKDEALKGIAILIHDFLVWGALYDWYLACGYLQQAGAIKAKVDKIEEDLASDLRTPSWTKRPLQPFGPARKKLF